MQQSLEDYNSIFFVGIGGISMSGLAVLLKHNGKQVSGSDEKKSEITDYLQKKGIKVFAKHRAKQVIGSDLVVFSGAVKEGNVEIAQPKKRNIPVIERSELLRLISERYENVIAISGTHGKTTTTAMIAHIFSTANLNPTAHLGGLSENFNGNILIGDKNFFITEACEFRDSFLFLSPNVSIITNFEEEHMDFFKSFEREVQSFKSFAQNTKNICYANISCKKHLGKQKNILYAGDKKSFHLKNVIKTLSKTYSFEVFSDKKFIGNFSLSVFGEHNVQNALMAICVALHYNIKVDIIKKALLTFKNVLRRFEEVGKFDGNLVVNDYAHHPTEIFLSIKTCKEVFDKKIICIFQPHTFSRTKSLIDKFANCFNGVEALYLVKTYSAREKFDIKGSAYFLKQKIMEKNPELKAYGDFSNKKTLQLLKKAKYKNCVFLFLGAGNVEAISRKLCKKKRDKPPFNFKK